MTDINLNALKAGINRLRTKGGADPSSLYDLVNGYVTIDGSIQSRPGTVRDAVLPAGTKGLCAFDGAIVVFSHQSTPITDPRYSCEVLVDPIDASQPIKEIHFVAPFMGALYVAAEFVNGDVYHYWLQGGTTWSANTNYMAGDLIIPTTPNGLAYKPSVAQNPPAWQADTAYAVGDVVQPTEYNGFKYTLIETDGDNPKSGATEPTWVESEDALVYEDIDNTPQPAPPTTTTRPPLYDRYRNRFGGESL